MGKVRNLKHSFIKKMEKDVVEEVVNRLEMAIELKEQGNVIGKYGQMIAEYYWENRKRDYCRMLLEGTWNAFLHEREVELVVKRIMKKEGVMEELKKRNPIEWVRRVNGIRV